MKLISQELKIAFIFSVTGFIFQFFSLISGFEKLSSKTFGIWRIILGRYFYEKNGYSGLIHFSICDFYITLLLLIYMNMMVLKFFGYHLTKNKKISGHYFNDLLVIGVFCIICRLSSFYVYN